MFVILVRTSDDSDLKDRLIRDGCSCCEIRKVNSIIFVVNAVEMMESESSYAHMISTAFNCPLLSFKGWSVLSCSLTSSYRMVFFVFFFLKISKNFNMSSR